MAIYPIQTKTVVFGGVRKIITFMVDSSADIVNLHTDIALGSMAMTIDSGQIFVLTNSGWVAL